MALTQWTDAMSGRRLDRAEVAGLWCRAREVYKANSHIFEDELDALFALGAVCPAQHDALTAA